MRLKNIAFALLTAVAILSGCSNKEQQVANPYPETRKVDTVTTYFGEQVKDPYRWLENDTATETADWVKKENDVTFAYLGKIPYRDKIKKRLEKIYNYERLSAPF